MKQKKQRKGIMMRSNVMKMAWQIAKAAVLLHGGKVKQYFALSLKMAWANTKQEGNKLSEQTQPKIWTVTKKIGGVDRALRIRVDDTAADGSESIAWQLDGNKNDRTADGYSHAAKMQGLNLVFACNQKFEGESRLVGGFSLPVEICNEIFVEIRAKKFAWQQRFDALVAQLVSGEREITYSLVGCDFPKYSANLCNNGDEINFNMAVNVASVEIFLKAAVDSGLYCDTYSMLAPRPSDQPALASELPSWVRNVELGAEGFDTDVVKKFTGRLPEILQPVIEKRRAEATERKAKAAEQKEIEENEVYFLSGEVLSSVNFRLLHSIGAAVEDNKIKVFTHPNSYLIPEARTTYHIREELKKMGCQFDGKEKNWVIADSAENREKIYLLLKKYDTKADPRKLGLHQCWECGRWVKHVDADGYCGC